MPVTHLAVSTQPWLDLILDGHKTIETRISKVKMPPFQSIDIGDHVIMKESGGPIKGAFEVERVETFQSESNLDDLVFDEIYRKDCLNIFGLPEVAYAYRRFIQQKWCNSKYATFLYVTNVRQFHPTIPIKKNDRKSWVILGDGSAEDWVDSDFSNV